MTADPTDLCFAGAAEQASLVRERTVSAAELIDATLRRIESIDPHLNAYRVVFDERAVEEAARIDERSADDESIRSLLGVPVAIKDDTDVAGQVTAWGTAGRQPRAAADAEVVTRLRRAGAIIVGKTHVPELTAWPWTSSPAWGATRNPWDRRLSPGGSSGGSAAAAAAGLCGVALGSDGGGSVRYPAAVTGLFGLKPQRDRIPLGPQHADGWQGLLAYGSLSRTVADAALFLDATADDVPALGYSSALTLSVRPLRIAVSLEPPPGSRAELTPQRRSAVEAIAELLRELGHHVIEHEISYGRQAMRNATIRYLAGVHYDASSLPAGTDLDHNTRRLALLGSTVPRWMIVRARSSEARLAATINEVFDHADVVLTPIAAGPPPSIDAVDRLGLIRSMIASNNGAWAMPWNAIGQPAAAVPAGFDTDGLPLSVQLCVGPNDEVTLLRLAKQIESARPWTQCHPPTSA